MSQQRVLLLDPEPDRRRALAELLTELHFEVLEAADGGAGLKLIESGNPDLVFCDQQVAGHGAAELCEYVREFVAGRLPFVLLVDPDLPDPDKPRREMGADGVLRQPVARYQAANLSHNLLALRDLEARLAYLQDENGQLRRALADKALIDPVTRFYRFDLFKQIIVLEVKRAKRYGYPLSILLLTFDNFQQVAGWLTPEQRQALYTHTRKMAGASIRDIDIPLLFAEEKVLIVMPHTELGGAAVVADRIRQRIVSIKPPGSLAQLKLSVSIAVASTESAEVRSFGTLIREAMRGLKEAEIKGGDVVLVCRAPAGDQDAGECLEVDGKLGPRTFFV